MVTGVGSSERAGPARGASFTATERVRLVRRNTALLIVAQGMAWTALPIFATVGPIGAFELSGRERSVGIMVALYGLAEAGAALITGRVMDRLGRRAGLAAGYALLAIGGGGAAWSVSAGWLGGLFASSVPIGAGAGAALLGRAAVADMYPVGRRGRAVGLLLAVGAFGAVGGPAMVEGAQRLTQGSSNGDPLVLPWFLVALLAAIGLGCVLARILVTCRSEMRYRPRCSE